MERSDGVEEIGAKTNKIRSTDTNQLRAIKVSSLGDMGASLGGWSGGNASSRVLSVDYRDPNSFVVI
jgi:hypothetical protein